MKTNTITTEAATISNIIESETSFGAFEADWNTGTSEGSVDAVIEALATEGFELDRCGAISGIFDERGRNADSMEVSHGTVHFRPIKK